MAVSDVPHERRFWYAHVMSSRLPAAERREQLLDVALHVFAKRGFHHTSMNDVAAAAGVTKPVVYHHFTNKRALYRELLDVVADRLLHAITTATEAADGPRAQVEQGLAAYFRFVVDDADAYRLMFGGGTRRDEEFAEAMSSLERSIAEVIAELIVIDDMPLDERLLLAHGIVGLAEGTSRVWTADDVDLGPDAVARATADLVWRGLRGLRTESP